MQDSKFTQRQINGISIGAEKAARADIVFAYDLDNLPDGYEGYLADDVPNERKWKFYLTESYRSFRAGFSHPTKEQALADLKAWFSGITFSLMIEETISAQLEPRLVDAIKMAKSDAWTSLQITIGSERSLLFRGTDAQGNRKSRRYNAQLSELI